MLETFCALLPFLLAGICDPALATDYVVEESVRDETTGLYVETGWLINVSSYCLVVSVFDDAATERMASEVRNPVMIACGVRDWSFRLEDGCYVLSAGYGTGSINRETWVDSVSGESICFEMWPPQKP
jgi:hypothetical protein